RNPEQDGPRKITNYDLTKRETAVLIEVARGLTNKEIAEKMNVSVHTVISHRKNIMHKTGIKSVAGLTVYAMLNNLIEE
ncbi:MAG: LuxR C-terminal-related transcriptional regulator, partial [Bacteroidales bacterium]|nr:LuxR C-terminal-related transcriptional regulator [Bacteroidales bacterium]